MRRSLLLLLLLPALARASDLPMDRATLAGLSGVFVAVANVPHAIKSQVDREILKTDIELKLRVLGIKVFNEAAAAGNKVMLYVIINGFTPPDFSPDRMAYTAVITAEQRVRLVRDSAIETTAATWSTLVGGTGNFAGIRHSIADGVDEFANAYLSVNPPRGRTDAK